MHWSLYSDEFQFKWQQLYIIINCVWLHNGAPIAVELSSFNMSQNFPVKSNGTWVRHTTSIDSIDSIDRFRITHKCFPTNHLRIICESSARIISESFANHMRIICELFANHSRIICESFANRVRIICDSFANHLWITRIEVDSFPTGPRQLPQPLLPAAPLTAPPAATRQPPTASLAVPTAPPATTSARSPGRFPAARLITIEPHFDAY